MITTTDFGTLCDGRTVRLYTLKNDAIELSVTDYGSTLVRLLVPDKNGKPTDVVLGYDDLAGYVADDTCFGNNVGRSANRIGGASFTLNGTEYKLAANDGENNLHSGPDSYSKRIWNVAAKTDTSITFSLESPHMDQGFPGNVTLYVTYKLTEEDAVEISYEATPDADTILNMTNHSYFNLAGCASGSIHDHVLTVEADAVTSVADNTLIPTGGYTPVAGTPFDMRHGLRLGDGLNATHSCPQMTFAGGYDHNFVLRKGEAMGLAARLYDPKSGRVMETLTDQPGVQVYTACGTNIPGGKGGTHYGKYCAVCLETQHFPDSPNHPQFIGTTVLRPGEKYDTTTIYAFRTE